MGRGNQSGASIGAKAIRLVGRLFATTVFAAVAGAVANFFYELFIRPDLYAVGPPLARGAFLIVLMSPFILGGLILLGLPLSYLLRRLSIENSFSYGVAGILGGLAYGVGLSQLHHAELLFLVGFYGAASALCWWWLRALS